MLRYRDLKNNTGFMLMGDYTTLRDLHQVIHTVNEQSPIVRNKEGMFLGLAYDIRKAYERQRHTIKAPEHTPEYGPMYGVEQLWPTVLIQTRMLRTSLAFMPSTKAMQAMTYALEDLVENAVAAIFKEESEEILRAYQSIDTAHPDPEDKAPSRIAQFSIWSKADRRKNLAQLISSLNPMYSFWHKQGLARGEKPPFDLDQLDALTWDDMVEPNW